jgi:hypothetical protein
MATTTNYSWETPDDTDLVKDGAAAIRTLGSSIDTTTKALNPSTTLGDVEYRSSTANTNTRLGIGTTGQVLSVVGGVPAWSTASTGMTLLSTTALTGASVTVSSISTSYNDLKLVFENVYSATDAVFIQTRFNADTGNKYAYQFYNTQDAGVRSGNTVGYIEVSKVRNSSGNSTSGYMLISDYNNINSVPGTMSFNYNLTHTQGGSFTYNNAAAITSVTVFMSSGNISGGTLKIYGVK